MTNTQASQTSKSTYPIATEAERGKGKGFERIRRI